MSLLVLTAAALGLGRSSAAVFVTPTPHPTPDQPSNSIPTQPAVTNVAAIAYGNGAYVPLLSAWWAEGTAAGNVGDYYENRDGGHSAFQAGDFPQLTRWGPNMPAASNDTGWGAARFVRPGVVVGNSSTAGSPPNGFSQGRRLFTLPENLHVVHQQYRSNNLYIYPEHADHDPGNGGSGGWGDLYLANSPYFFNSQGSSTTDLPFVRGAVASLAAFRPDTKMRLKEHGLLMPTLQMLFRFTSTNLMSPDDYFTGRAHPSAFEPTAVDPLRMVQMAHEILPDSLPPLAQIHVLQEDSPGLQRGVHFFDVNPVEALVDTPGSVARIWRSLDLQRRLVVSAETSFDANQLPLTYRWVVLRGDPSRISIRSLNANRSRVEVRFEWAGRQPIQPGSRLQSSRQEIALFVSNGVWWSAPAFLSWYGSDRELRTYDPAGRLLDVGYAAGGVVVEIRELTPFLDWLQREPQDPAVQLVLGAVGATVLHEIAAIQDAIRQAEALEASTLAANGFAITARNEAYAALAEAEKKAQADGADPNSPEIQALRTVYNQKSAAVTVAVAAYNAARSSATQVTEPARRLIASVFERLAEDPDFIRNHARFLGPLWGNTSISLRNFINTAKNRLTGFGMVSVGSGSGSGFEFDWTFASATGRPEPTVFERNLLADFHAKWLGQIVRPNGVTVRFLSHMVDRAIFAPKDWRDVYQHDSAGGIVGWRRFCPGRAVEEFTAEGHLVLSRDLFGRPQEAVGVSYVVPRQSGIPSVNSAMLELQRNSRYFTYLYGSDTDLRGRPLENR